MVNCMKSVAFHNLGCKVNAYEIEVMQQMLQEKGYQVVPFDTKADIYIINTCTVTNIADRKSRQMLHRVKKLNPDSIVVAVGCYVQIDSETVEKAYNYSKESSRSGDLMVEEYMEGPEVSVETLSVNGVCHVIQITDKLTTDAPYFVEMGHSQPSGHTEEIKKQIAKVAIAANHAIGISNGPSHTEIKITKDGPKVVELGARLGGDNITTYLTPLSTGVDMVESCIRIALGETADLEPKFHKASAIRYFRVEQGFIRDIRGLEEARKIPGVKQIYVVHGIGEKMNGIKSSGDRSGFVIAQADTAEEAVKICEKALDLIKIEME